VKLFFYFFLIFFCLNFNIQASESPSSEEMDRQNEGIAIGLEMDKFVDELECQDLFYLCSCFILGGSACCYFLGCRFLTFFPGATTCCTLTTLLKIQPYFFPSNRQRIEILKSIRDSNSLRRAKEKNAVDFIIKKIEKKMLKREIKDKEN
tara:strand:- start:715 stop:1164 length:450 start_codon:yes stop_codon:yes gene_type:complete